MDYCFTIDNAKHVKLNDYNPDDAHGADKISSAAIITDLSLKLSELQELLYAANTHSVLIVLQGMDTSGKDGTIAHVMSSVNPQGCAVASFKVPTALESQHDFLWRVHDKAPAHGMITIFNRSHYEDVLITRVHKLIDKEMCRKRYTQIINFEDLLVENNTIIMKFYLHISKDEQERRLLDREKETEKAWKISAGDWTERQYWSDYTEAYEDALGTTGTKNAPWYIVNANHKWYRNLSIASTIVHRLEPYKPEWRETLKAVGKQRMAELERIKKTIK